MSGKILVSGLIAFTFVFALILYYFQVFAYYQRVDSLDYIKVQEKEVPIKNYMGIDSKTSGLKLRGCFVADPKTFNQLIIYEKGTPLSAPFWFRCFNSDEIQVDLNVGKAKAFVAEENEKDGIDRIVAIYPNGSGFQWRQLNSKYLD